MQSDSWEPTFRKNLLTPYTGSILSTIKTKASFLLWTLVTIYVTRRRCVHEDNTFFDSHLREYLHITVLFLICSRQTLQYYFNHNTTIFFPRPLQITIFDHVISPVISNNSSTVVNVVTFENTNIFVAYCFRSLIFVWPRIIETNNIDNQLDATVMVTVIIPISSTCFGRWFRPSSGAQDCVYSLWYNAPTMLVYHKL
jgi:hypothetical protein